MNTRFAFGGAVLFVATIACETVNLPLATATPPVLPTATLISASAHFENEWVAFDHPQGLTVYAAGFEDPIWYPTVDFGGELVAGLGDERFFGFDNYYRSIRILRRRSAPGADLEGIMADVYAQTGPEHAWPLVDGVLNLDGPITIDGHDAVQKSYRIYSGEPAYELRDVWIRVDNEFYIVSIGTEWTNPEDFDTFESMADDLLESLVIK